MNWDEMDNHLRLYEAEDPSGDRLIRAEIVVDAVRTFTKPQVFHWDRMRGEAFAMCVREAKDALVGDVRSAIYHLVHFATGHTNSATEAAQIEQWMNVLMSHVDSRRHGARPVVIGCEPEEVKEPDREKILRLIHMP